MESKRQPSKLGIVCILMLALCPSLVAGAQTTPTRGTDVVVDPAPLRPPDTSSPRDTLRSFLANVDIAIQALIKGTQNDVSDRAELNAVMALDYSATPDGDSWTVQIERALLLKEILDRIKLPEDHEIPGVDETAEYALIMDADRALQAEPPGMTKEGAQRPACRHRELDRAVEVASGLVSPST